MQAGILRADLWFETVKIPQFSPKHKSSIVFPLPFPHLLTPYLHYRPYCNGLPGPLYSEVILPTELLRFTEKKKKQQTTKHPNLELIPLPWFRLE